MPEGLSYAAAGVDIEAYERVLERVKPLIAATHGKEVAVGVGPFAGLYALPGGGHLAASADGVGTKIKVAIAAGSHRGIGTDIVNHCVNDIATAGARPLFFLDYFATGRLDPEVFAQLIEGMTAACTDAACALLGGETAEMPGVYALGDYDLAGFTRATSSSACRRAVYTPMASRSSARCSKTCPWARSTRSSAARSAMSCWSLIAHTWNRCAPCVGRVQRTSREEAFSATSLDACPKALALGSNATRASPNSRATNSMKSG